MNDSPLETLSIQFSQLSESDLKHLPWCQSLFQLKHLNLLGVPLFKLSLTHLQILLERCSKLNRVKFYYNGISTFLLKDILYCMANLSTLTEEFYPAPLECYDEMGHILVDKFANLCPDLLNILRSKRHPKEGSFGTEICFKSSQCYVYNWRTGVCLCHKKL
ncbi:hypothetical protein U0070_025664 [Myodes glareolus]|uniref:Uncharacterized protein n=1 Tax=Myodes glareolus TaxID=447135 RepID=A0AAW0I3Y1_MYOGA